MYKEKLSSGDELTEKYSPNQLPGQERNVYDGANYVMMITVQRVCLQEQFPH